MDYRKTAQEIYDHIGKKENIISAAHCATRLRLVISDNSKADKEYVENIEGVKGVFFAQGQMQIILGTGVVNKVYDEFIRIAGVSESSKEELKKVAASRANPVQRLIKTLGDIFVPIIPAIVPSKGEVVAPCDAVVETVFDTKHAVGLSTESGMELLIHIGINTVELNGKYFTSHVKNGDHVKKGQLLVSFDMEKVKAAGYDVTTPLIVTNSDDYKDVKILSEDSVTPSDKVLEIVK